MSDIENETYLDAQEENYEEAKARADKLFEGFASEEGVLIGDNRHVCPEHPEAWQLTKEQYLRFYGLEQAVKFSAAISTPDAAMSVAQMISIADQFVDYVKGDDNG